MIEERAETGGDMRNEGGMRGVSRVTLVMFVTRYVCLL